MMVVHESLSLASGWMLITCLVACLGASLPAAAQTQDPKPPAAEEKRQDEKEKPAPPPRRGRETQKRDPGEERPRLDVPVSFPVDI
jgi:hypothetical protein